MKYATIANLVAENKIFRASFDDLPISRYFHKNGFVFELNRRSCKRGCRFDFEDFAGVTIIQEKVLTPDDKVKKWLKDCDKAVCMLEDSGINPKLLIELKVIKEWVITNGLDNLRHSLKIGDVNVAEMFVGCLKIKKMETRNGENDLLKIAIFNKDPYTEKFAGRTYDISYEYNPLSSNINAWYSEEFRGCANGHYYLMLNSTHAIYCEND